MPNEQNLSNAEQEIMDLFHITDDDGGTTTPPANPQPEPAPATPASQVNNPQPANPEPAANSGTPEPQPTPAPEPKNEPGKQNRAFAEMRIQNKNFENLIMDLAKATGKNISSIAEAQEVLRSGLTKVTAQARNIPEDVQRELDESRRALSEFKQQQASQKALAGFQQVKDTYGLTRQEIDTFADELVAHGINPLEQDVDVIKEYRNMHFEDIINKAVEKAVQEERLRSTKAQTNSTTPSNVTGGTGDAGERQPIKSVKDLNSFLDGLK